jgi:hypothetical protein
MISVMKQSFIVILVLLLTGQTAALGQNSKNKAAAKADTITVDSLEHRIIIMDPGFDFWLATQPSKEFYSKQYYEFKNRLYVAEWNHRYTTGQDGAIYDNLIDYNIRIDYGIDINYKLYYYFKYFEHTTGITLLNTSKD